jgi:myo-inositol-1(or 4)-monophosphatase
MYDFIRDTAHAAGEALARCRATDLDVRLKADSSLVTAADLASERAIIERIRQRFPDDLVLSEEAGLSSVERRPGTHIWIIDPLDGTTNFANGYPFYCVSIGRGRFRADGSIEIVNGAILDAARGRLYYAGLGEGAYVDGRPIAAAAPRELARCFLVTGFYYMKDDDLDREIRRFARVAQACQSIRRDGSAALDLALAAEGVFDAFWEVGLQPWDVAAGALIVSEAGGLVRNYAADVHGYSVEGTGIIAGSAQAVRQIAELL